jgi:hypothetical protein
VEHLKAAAAEEGQVLAAVKETMRIHVEGEERLQQQNSALQFQLADQQRLAADLGRSPYIRKIHMFLVLLDPDPDRLVRGMYPRGGGGAPPAAELSPTVPAGGSAAPRRRSWYVWLFLGTFPSTGTYYLDPVGKIWS